MGLSVGGLVVINKSLALSVCMLKNTFKGFLCQHNSTSTLIQSNTYGIRKLIRNILSNGTYFSHYQRTSFFNFDLDHVQVLIQYMIKVLCSNLFDR